MPLNFIRGGGLIFRHLQCRTVRIPATISQARNLYLAANSRSSSNQFPNNNHATRRLQSGQLVNSFATARGRSEGTAKGTTKGTAKGTKKTATSKSAKDTKKGSRKVDESKLKAKEEKEEKYRNNQLIKHLKTLVLDPPKKRPTSVYTLAIQETLPRKIKEVGNTPQAFKEAVQNAKSMPAEETERYAAIRDQNVAANAADYDNWLKSHSPLQIKNANAARRKLMKLTNFKKGLLHDERLVKRPATAYITFCAEELRAGSNVKAAAEKWKTLSEAEKKRFVDLEAEDLERYKRDYAETYGQELNLKNYKKWKKA